MESEITYRALEFCKYKGITAADFERNCGLANGMLKKLGENTRKQTFIRISNAFPDLNTEWLRTGVGEMIKATSSITQAGNNNVLQNGQAGHDLNQTNNSEKLLLEFINGLKSQGSLTEMTLKQLGVAMSQTDKALEMMHRLITMLERSKTNDN